MSDLHAQIFKLKRTYNARVISITVTKYALLICGRKNLESGKLQCTCHAEGFGEYLFLLYFFTKMVIFKEIKLV